MKIEMLMLLCTLILSCTNANNSRETPKLSEREKLDSMINQNEINRQKVLVDQIEGKGESVPKGNELRLSGLPAYQITSIKLKEYYFTKNETVKNVENRLLENEVYFAINLVYKFYTERVAEYDPNEEIITVFHTRYWYLVDTQGKYYKALTNLKCIDEVNCDLFFDSTQESPASIASSVGEGKTVEEKLLFKMPQNAVPLKLIYLDSGFSYDEYFSVQFML